MSVVAIIDCGMGNLHSVKAGIARACPKTKIIISQDSQTIAQADKVIFPGDGHFDACIKAIDRLNLRQTLIDVATHKPFLGICVGMQVLFTASKEGQLPGLGLLPATIQRLPKVNAHKIPHLGWNNTYHHQSHLWTDGIDNTTRFYFIHSYYAPIGPWTLMRADYGVEFSAVIQTQHIFATQFHPEKSGHAGINLLSRFIRY